MSLAPDDGVCFLNRWRGLDAVQMRDQGINPNTQLTDSLGGNLFHAVLIVAGLVLNLAGVHFRQFTLWSMGFLIGGAAFFFFISFIFNNLPEFYSCYILGFVPFGAGCLCAIYALKILGEEKVFEILGFLAGLVMGYFVYVLVLAEAVDTGTTILGYDIAQALVILGGGGVGILLMGKVEFVRRNILMIYSALVGSMCLITGIDYLAVAHGMVNFRPVSTTAANPAQREVGTHAAMLMLAGIIVAVGGFYFQLRKLRPCLIYFGFAVATEDELRAQKEAHRAANEWKAQVDPSTGKTYYYNAKGETRWDNPASRPGPPPRHSTPPGPPARKAPAPNRPGPPPRHGPPPRP